MFKTKKLKSEIGKFSRKEAQKSQRRGAHGKLGGRADDTSPSALLMKYVRRTSSGLRPAEPRLGNSPPAAEKEVSPNEAERGRWHRPSGPPLPVLDFDS